MFKATILFVVAILAVQGAHITYRDESKELQLAVNDIFDEIKELLQKLKDAVDAAVAKVKEWYAKLEAEIESVANEVIDTTKDGINKAMDELFAEFDEMIAEVGDKDITACVNVYEPQLKGIPAGLVDSLVSCVTSRVHEGEAIINDAVARVDNILNEIITLEQEIDDCGTGFSAVLCLTKLAVKITEDIIDFPDQIMNDYDRAEKLIETLIPTIKDCAVGKVEDVPTQGKVILENFGKCIIGL